MLATHEIDEVRSVAHLNRRVRSPDGMILVTHVCKTIPLPVWLLRTSSHELECSSHHLVEVASGEFVQAARLRPGTLVNTVSGLEPVTVSKDIGEIRPLFDLRVEGQHRYYTNGICSHNSTGIGGSSLFGLNTTEGWKGLYIAPLQEHCKTFADRLMEMQRGSIVPPEMIIRSGRKCNMYYKESLRGGSLKLLHVLTDPTKVRGNSAAHIKVDECVRGGTIIVTALGEKKIVDIRPNDIIVAFDEHNRTTHDVVRSLWCRGNRHTWRIRTARGRSIEATGNERLWTPTGWRYLAEFISAEASAVCPVAQQVKSIVDQRARHDTGDVAGRRILHAQREIFHPVQGRTLPSAKSILPEQISPAAGLLQDDGGPRSGESGVGGNNISVLDAGVSDLRIFTLHVLPTGSRPAGSVPESCDAGLGGSVELASGSVVVPGRRGPSGEVDGVLDALFHTGGVREVGCVADGERSEGWSEEDQEARGNLLVGESADRSIGNTHRENTSVHARDHVVQAARQGAIDMRHLRAAVREEEQRGHVCVSGLSRYPQEGCEDICADAHDTGTAEDEIRQVSDDPKDRPETDREAEASANYSHAGDQGGPRAPESLSGQQETVEISTQCARDIRAAMPDAHVRVLRQNFSELYDSQNVAAESVHPLHDSSVQNLGGGTVRRPATGQSPGEVGARLIEDEIVSIEYAGVQEVFDIETEKYHTFFADGIAVHNCQNFDPDHLPEIEQVQKAYLSTRTTTFAGTSLHKNTCLDAMYNLCSRGVWHVRCSCPKKFHALNSIKDIPNMMSVSGLCCPDTGRLLNPLIGEYVHESPSLLAMRQASFHIPQVIVPEYAVGEAWLAIWKDFKRYELNKFLQEVMGIAVDAGQAELSEDDLKACCDDYGLTQIQSEILSGKRRYNYMFSGLDWGGSDWNQATRTKQSYTVHSMYGLEPDGRLRLVYAYRYSGAHYQQIAGNIVAAHNKFRGFGVGSDNGGGQYYNAYLRDCGRIPSKRIVHFNYSDVKLMLERIPHPDAIIASLHRTDSISAVFSDIRNKRIIFPRWEDARPFAMDFLNVTRNITERPSGNTIFRYLKDPRVADDFLHSTNYACMMKRITMGEPLIPNAQLVRELQALFGVAAVDLRGSGGGVRVQGSGPGFVSG